MKYLLIAIALILTSCASKSKQKCEKPCAKTCDSTIVKVDTVAIDSSKSE